jgi:iron complex transport system substrate-binding protein
MEPVGEVTFDDTPSVWESYFPGYADIGVALGRADGLTAVGFMSRYHTTYYDELDGVSVDKSDLTELIGDNGIDNETYYELDNDVHLTDPEWLTNNDAFALEGADVDEIEENVGPRWPTVRPAHTNDSPAISTKPVSSTDWTTNGFSKRSRTNGFSKR